MNQTQIYQVLSAIQKRANDRFPHLWKTEEPDKDILFILDKGIAMESLPKWKRDYYRVMRKEYDKTETVLDEEQAKAKDAFIDNEITKKINQGKLPPREEIAKYVQDTIRSKTHADASARASKT